MRTEKIAAIGIDEAGRLWVQPSTATFERVYCAGMGLNWDASRARLYAPTPREWSQARWFEQIRTAVLSEYQVTLTIEPSTSWTNINDDLKRAIEALPSS